MNSFFELVKRALYSKLQILPFKLILAVLFCSWTSTAIFAQENSYAVMEVVEVKFESEQQYDNAYIDVDVWIELKKSESANEVYRIPIFWDGENIFRARLVATSPGDWTWNIINATVENLDPAFMDKKGSFTAIAADVTINANNHGFIKVSENNRTLEYADGTPYFYTADTSWSALTEVFDYNHANDISGISFQDYILARKNQGFNGLNVIASFPDDTYIADYNKNKQFPNRTKGLWSDKTWGKKVGPSGATPFEMKDPNAATTDWSEEVDYKKINPEYWKSVDQRMQFLSDEGFVTLFESVRRHERWPFRTDASEKDAFYNYVRYLWARYGCYNMIFSWVHLDSDAKVYKPWRSLVAYAHNKLSAQLGGQMPYGQPKTAMSFDTSLTNWGNPNESESQAYPGLSAALDVQNVSNAGRDESMHQWLNDLYDKVEQPALNLEPFYPGWGLHSGNEINEGLDDTSMAQMQMYGSVLSGGLAGHAWGDAWYAGAASSTGRSSADGGTIVSANDPQVNALDRFDSQAMGHLKSFMLDAGHEYGRLIPAADTHLSDSKNFLHTLSISDDEEFALGFFAGDLRSDPVSLPTITNLMASKTYLFEWWNVTTGNWIAAGKIETDDEGILQSPTVPNNDRSKSWAYRIRSEAYIGDEIIDEVVDEPTNNFIFRINAGGDEILQDGNVFSADTSFNTGNTLNRPQTNLEDPYKSFRYSRSQEMSYDIALEDGEYTVLLHFAELWFGATGGGTGGEGLRVFDVLMEDNLVEDNLDVFAEVGAETLLTKTYTVNVTDGQLDIDFSSLASDGGSRHPIINAIEVLASEVVDIPEEEEEEEEVENELDELIGHWPLDEQNGINANDVSNKGLVGTLKNGLTFDTHKTDGHIGSAVNFDGLDKRISLPDIDNNLQAGLSVSAWVNPSNAEGGYQGIVGSSTSGGFMMFIKQNKLAFKVTTNENGKKLVSAGNIQNNSWQMITCTYDGNTMQWYINGENVHSETLSGTIKDKDEAWLGWSGWGEEFFEGDMDDVRLFNKALTDEQIFTMYENHIVVNENDNLSAKEEPSIVEGAQAFAYPNPTVGRFKISGLSSGIKNITVFDFASDVLISLESNQTEPELDISAYPNGIYIIRVLQNGLEQAFKVVKE